MRTYDRSLYFPGIDTENLRSTLTEWRNASPKLGVLVMLPEDEKSAVSALQETCNSLSIPLVGAIFPELILDGRFVRKGIWLLAFNEMPHHELRGDLIPGAEQVARLTTEISNSIQTHCKTGQEVTMFMVFDSMVPNIASILDELYLKLANRAHYAGVNAGSETFQPMACLFDNSRLVQNGLLVLLLPDHKGLAVEHDYEVPEHLITATSATGNRIVQIDWRPAFRVYQEMVQKQFGIKITRDNFYQYSVHFPFGIVRANHQTLVRIPVALDDSDALFCVGEVPPNSILALLHAPEVGESKVTSLMQEELHNLDAAQRDDLLLFYCAGRRMHLGVDAAQHEISDLHEKTGVKKVAGALSLGEIGSSSFGGYPLFHNATLVAGCS